VDGMEVNTVVEEDEMEDGEEVIAVIVEEDDELALDAGSTIADEEDDEVAILEVSTCKKVMDDVDGGTEAGDITTVSRLMSSGFMSVRRLSSSDILIF
jgi:hypothetical protein